MTLPVDNTMYLEFVYGNSTNAGYNIDIIDMSLHEVDEEYMEDARELCTRYQNLQYYGKTTVVGGGVHSILAATAPTAGTWALGDRIINSTPAVAAPKAWVCTVAGTPGTWVSEGNL